MNCGSIGERQRKEEVLFCEFRRDFGAIRRCAPAFKLREPAQIGEHGMVQLFSGVAHGQAVGLLGEDTLENGGDIFGASPAVPLHDCIMHDCALQAIVKAGFLLGTSFEAHAVLREMLEGAVGKSIKIAWADRQFALPKFGQRLWKLEASWKRRPYRSGTP